MALYNSIILKENKNICNKLVYYNFFGKNHFVCQYQRLLGSNLLYLATRALVKKLCIFNPQKVTIPKEES